MSDLRQCIKLPMLAPLGMGNMPAVRENEGKDENEVARIFM